MKTTEPEALEFVPIIYGQTERKIVEGWNYGGDPELQNIILKLYYEVKDHRDILCSISGGYDSCGTSDPGAD